MVFALVATRGAARPVQRLGAPAWSRGLQQFAFGLLVALVVLFPAVNELVNENYDALPLSVTLAALPLVLAMGVAEGLLDRYRARMYALLAATASPTVFARAARRALAGHQLVFAATLVALSGAVGGLTAALSGAVDRATSCWRSTTPSSAPRSSPPCCSACWAGPPGAGDARRGRRAGGVRAARGHPGGHRHRGADLVRHRRGRPAGRAPRAGPALRHGAGAPPVRPPLLAVPAYFHPEREAGPGRCSPGGHRPSASSWSTRARASATAPTPPTPRCAPDPGGGRSPATSTPRTRPGRSPTSSRRPPRTGGATASPRSSPTRSPPTPPTSATTGSSPTACAPARLVLNPGRSRTRATSSRRRRRHVRGHRRRPRLPAAAQPRRAGGRLPPGARRAARDPSRRARPRRPPRRHVRVRHRPPAAEPVGRAADRVRSHSTCGSPLLRCGADLQDTWAGVVSAHVARNAGGRCAAVVACCLLAVAGCTPRPEDVTTPAAQARGWQYQLQGRVDTSVDAATFIVDGFDVDAATVADLQRPGPHRHLLRQRRRAGGLAPRRRPVPRRDRRRPARRLAGRALARHPGDRGPAADLGRAL